MKTTYTISASFNRDGGNEIVIHYISTLTPHLPPRTLLSTNFTWVNSPLRSKFENIDLAMKWFKMFAKGQHFCSLSLNREIEYPKEVQEQVQEVQEGSIK